MIRRPVQRILFFVMAAGLTSTAFARVVINEIFYHPPDGLTELEFVELHNASDDPVDLSGWKFTKGLKFTFAPGTHIDAGGFLVLCRNEQRFHQYYSVPIAGTFTAKLSNNGERLELTDARGRVVDTVKYQDSTPWPMGADGLSGSLERICPDSGGDYFVNWASSPLSPDRRRPAGSPGRTNACYSEVLPPIISQVRHRPDPAMPGGALTIEATVRDPEGIGEVTMLYRVGGIGIEQPEIAVKARSMENDLYAAEIPPVTAGRLVRYRIRATGSSGARRMMPADTEPRMTYSAYVGGPISPGGLPEVSILDPGSEQPAALVWRERQGVGADVMDYIDIHPRKDGLEVHFAKGQSQRGVTALDLQAPLAGHLRIEVPLAAELYRRAAVATPRSEFVQLTRNGQALGPYLTVEQINRGFLRRNRIDDSGTLYKTKTRGRTIAERYDNKTSAGHDDLTALLGSLNGAADSAQWAVIRKQFHVEPVINLFAAATVMGSRDAVQSGYYLYHDREDTERWMIFPVVSSGAWGRHRTEEPDDATSAVQEGEAGVKADEPLPFAKAEESRGGGEVIISKILLTNPTFRSLYLARTREIAESMFTETIFHPVMDALAQTLGPVDDPLRKNVDALKSYLRARRAYLLAQPEIRDAGRFSTAGLEKPVSRKAAKAANKTNNTTVKPPRANP